MGIQPRKFQHTFGRSAKTKALDVVYNNRRTGVNITQLSEQTGQSYQYAILLAKDLERRGLIEKQVRGVETILRPIEDNPVIQWIKKAPP